MAIAEYRHFKDEIFDTDLEDFQPNVSSCFEITVVFIRFPRNLAILQIFLPKPKKSDYCSSVVGPRRHRAPPVRSGGPRAGARAPAPRGGRGAALVRPGSGERAAEGRQCDLPQKAPLGGS